MFVAAEGWAAGAGWTPGEERIFPFTWTASTCRLLYWIAAKSRRHYEGYFNVYDSSPHRSVINRHEATVNCLFMDWSVRKIGLKELWTLKWHNQWDTAGPWTKAGGVRPEDWPEWMRRFKDY